MEVDVKSFRAISLAFIALIALTLSCSFVDGIFNRSPAAEDGPVAEEAVELPQAPDQAPVEELPDVVEEPTIEPDEDEPRRREVPVTPTPFEINSSEDVRRNLDMSAPDYVDYFDVEGTWFDFDNEGRASFSFVEGSLYGVDYEPEELYTWWSYSERQSGNLYTEINVTNGDCIDKDSVGLAIRVDLETASKGYSLQVSCDGNWRFRRHRSGQGPLNLSDWTPSELINTGPDATNRLGVWAYLNRFVLFINGVEVGEVFDPNNSYSFGSFAVYVNAFLTYDLTANFDDFAFWHVKALP
jgi:hypothetical protein